MIKELGWMTYFKIMGGVNRGLITGIDFCTKLLSSEPVQASERLTYHILVKLYKAFLMDGKYHQALERLKIALDLRPGDILTNFRVAEIHESLGQSEAAIQTHRNLIENSDAPESLKAYFSSQIKRIRTDGPRTRPPMPGLKNMSW